jgi:hypothetical protein
LIVRVEQSHRSASCARLNNRFGLIPLALSVIKTPLAASRHSRRNAGVVLIPKPLDVDVAVAGVIRI